MARSSRHAGRAGSRPARRGRGAGAGARAVGRGGPRSRTERVRRPAGGAEARGADPWRRAVRAALRAAALAAAAPVAYLLTLLTAAALGSRRRPPAAAASGPCITVIVPAHDEEAGVAATVESVIAAGCTPIVVADN